MMSLVLHMYGSESEVKHKQVKCTYLVKVKYKQDFF